MGKAIQVAIHLVIVGGLAGIALQLHDGHVLRALCLASVAAACVLMLAGALALTKRLLDKQ